MRRGDVTRRTEAHTTKIGRIAQTKNGRITTLVRAIGRLWWAVWSTNTRKQQP
jgi:hypothetical protein